MTDSLKHRLIRRDDYNRRILDTISKILDKCPDLRFNQIMYIVNEQRDYFNEEPWITLDRINEKFKNTDN
jgi:hypothetical protein